MRIDPAYLVAFPVCLLSLVLHECAHGVTALGCGDATARERGRLTLNPLPHLDPVGSLLLPNPFYGPLRLAVRTCLVLFGAAPGGVAP